MAQTGSNVHKNETPCGHRLLGKSPADQRAWQRRGHTLKPTSWSV